MKTFTYHVDGTDFTDVEAFGKAWKDAKALAEQKHCIITRTVTIHDVKEEFYASGAFIGMDHYSDDRAWVF